MTPEPTSTASTPRTPRTAGTEVADRRRGARRGRTRRATLVATTGLGVLGVGIDLGIPAAVAAPPMARPIVRGKVAAVGTTSFTLIRGVATITVDVSPSTTYADTAVSAPSLSTLAQNERVAVVGTVAGTNLVDATEVRILPVRPIVRGKVAAVGTTSFTLIRGVATITVDVSPSTTYADKAVSAPSLSTLAQDERVAVVGTVAGTNVVDATEVRILPGQSAAHRHARAGIGRRDGRDDRRQPGHRPH